MNTKAFILLMVGILVLGGSIGGAFAGGVALGKSQGNTQTQTTPSTQSGSQLSSQQQLDQLRQQMESGQISPEQLSQLRQQRQGQFGQGGGGMGFAGRGGLTGIIEKIEGNMVTISTAQGPLTASVGADTTIQLTVEGTLEDLEEGVSVMVVGQRGEDGTVEATSVVTVPANGGGGLFGGRSFSRDSQQGKQQSP